MNSDVLAFDEAHTGAELGVEKFDVKPFPVVRDHLQACVRRGDPERCPVDIRLHVDRRVDNHDRGRELEALRSDSP